METLKRLPFRVFLFNWRFLAVQPLLLAVGKWDSSDKKGSFPNGINILPTIMERERLK
jgi:hypothetical protein